MNTSQTISSGTETFVFDAGGIERITLKPEDAGWHSWDEIKRIVIVGDDFRWVMEPKDGKS